MMIFADNSCGACRAAQPELSRLVEMAQNLTRFVLWRVPQRRPTRKRNWLTLESLGVESKDVVRIRPLPREIANVPVFGDRFNRKGTVLHFQEGVRNTEEIGRLLLSLRTAA
jgi:hypothetical protein